MFDGQTPTLARGNFTYVDCGHADESFADALISGLSQERKAIPCRFLYDLRGSQLFDQICELPEYYPTRTETAILRLRAQELADLIGPNASLIELGSGSSTKTRILLDAMDAPSEYLPIDVSAEHLRVAAARIADLYPAINVTAICGNYASSFEMPTLHGRPIAFFPGSTIGNLDDGEAALLLQAWRSRLAPDGLMIIGVDLRKPAPLLQAAYDDQQGITARFIFNILERANRELNATFDRAQFSYDASYSDARGRIEMHLRSNCAQTVLAAGRKFDFSEGEMIHVENSHKSSIEEFETLARRAGFEPAACFVDQAQLFSVHVLAVQSNAIGQSTPSITSSKRSDLGV